MDKYYFSHESQKLGPFSLAELGRDSRFNEKSLVWREGLQDWCVAKELEDCSVLFDQIPPLVTDMPSDKTHNRNEKKGLKTPSSGWIVAGFIFAILGGWGGFVIGINYARGRYDKETKQIGWAMIIISAVARAVIPNL